MPSNWLILAAVFSGLLNLLNNKKLFPLPSLPLQCPAWLVQGHKFLDGKDRAWAELVFGISSWHRGGGVWVKLHTFVKPFVAGLLGRWIADKTYELYRRSLSRVSLFWCRLHLTIGSRWRGLIDHLTPKPHNWVEVSDWPVTSDTSALVLGGRSVTGLLLKHSPKPTGGHLLCQSVSYFVYGQSLV